jgi:DNA-binding GntR family transcriptional regulator
MGDDMRGSFLGKRYERPATLSESIYSHLKKAIIEGNLKPGQRLLEKEFAELFKASTTPIREAFQKLSAEKYIVINSRKDVTVATVTRREMAELFEVVRVLDALAARKAVPNLSDADLVELRRMTTKLREFHDQNKLSEYVIENMRIHDRVWRACRNEYLYECLSSSADRYVFLGNPLFALGKGSTERPSIFEQSLQDHFDLMNALEKRDTAAVEKILLSHWGKGFLGEEETEDKVQVNI